MDMTATPDFETYRSADERRAEGKALRDAAPRVAHGHWKAPEERPDPIEVLINSNDGRLSHLVPSGSAA